MGSLFGQLTQPGSALTDSSGNAAMVGSPSQVRDKLLSSSANFKPFANSDMSPGTPIVPGESPLHKLGIGQPSYADAASAGATPGGANAASPGLTKAGKLATLLTSGLQGALAGRAKSEETVAATGGRRAGGAGMGFEAGFTLPWQRASQQNQLAQQQAQTGVLRSEAQNYNIPGVGPIPGWLAKAMGPAYLRSQATENAATTRAGATTQAAQTAAGAKVQAAEIGQKFKAVPGVGLYDTEAKQVVPGTAKNVTITPEIAADYQLPQEFVGKPMDVGQLASLERAQNQQTTTVQGAAGPALVNKRTAKTTPLGLGAPSMGGIVPVAADPNNPGNITYAPKSKAVGMSSPQGAPTAAAKTEARAEVPTKIGDQKVAFNTMIQHADLLRKAAKALNNGDVQALNGLENSFKNAFGYSGPITAQAIADAYGGEVTNVIAKGHITDKEMDKTGRTIDPQSQNFETIDSVLSAYQALAKSKMNMLNQQANAARTGSASTSTSGAPTAADMLKKYPPKR